MSTVTITASPSERAVRFHDECVLIPEPPPRSKMPRFVTKSYSLPLWKKKPSEVTDLVSPVDDYVGFKVSVPSLTTKSPSPTRETFVPQSCLSHQSVPVTAGSPPQSPPLQRRFVRRASLPLPVPAELITVPLRDCCPDCAPICEESLKEGDEWKEKFTKAARRRRNSSADAPRTLLHNQNHHPAKSERPPSPFAGIMCINVDEVDRKWGSGERRRSKDDVDTERESDSNTTGVAAVPIKEEDEDQLFPLPSPRRSPSASPSPSPNASLASLAPNGSTSDFVEAAAKRSRELLTPSRTTFWTPPTPPPITVSHSAPLPSRKLSPTTLSLNTSFLESDKLASVPMISRSSRSPSAIRTPKSNPFTKASSGILKGVMGLGSPPMM